MQVYSVLAYTSVHSLDQSGRHAVDLAHVHLLHLITVAHLVQVLLTSNLGTAHPPQNKIHILFLRSLIYLSFVEELCMEQDSKGSEEEELTCQLYNTLRKHLGR